jgi:MFS family permease
MQYNSSYMATTALTGIPFIIAAVSSLGSTILSQVIGKRIIFIVSGFLMLIGVLWNMHVFSTYGWFMVSRVMQAVGWGASEGLVLISIRDIFFVSGHPTSPDIAFTDDMTGPRTRTQN